MQLVAATNSDRQDETRRDETIDENSADEQQKKTRHRYQIWAAAIHELMKRWIRNFDNQMLIQNKNTVKIRLASWQWNQMKRYLMKRDVMRKTDEMQLEMR